MLIEENRKTKLLIYDVIFKAVFKKEQDILFKMVKDIFDIDDDVEIVTEPYVISGLETPPSNKSGKTYKGDMQIRLSDKSIILIEMNNRNDKSQIDRNMIYFVRVHNNMLKSGVPDSELEEYRIRGLNLNNFRNDNDIPVENFAFCSLNNNRIASYIYTICNISLVKCKELVYNKCIEKLPKVVRWGSILLEEDIDKISQILGDDMLTMEEKENFLKTIEDVNNDKEIITEWMREENYRLKYEGQMRYAREEGISEGIEQGIQQKELQLVKNMLKVDAGYDFIFFLGAEASTDMFEAGASDYKHIPENDDNNIEKNKLKIYNLKSFGYELGLQALYMTKTEDEVKNDIKATELTEKYLPNMIKRNDNRQWIDGTTLVGDPYYWYEDKPVSAEEEVKPILNVKCSEFFIDITNPMIVAMGKLGLANVNVLKDDDGRYYYVSEVGYVEFGDKKIMMVPCELANDLVSGEVSYTAQYSYSHTEYPYPTFAEIAEDDDLIVFGMANDSIGYVIPDNDYLQTLLWYDPYGVAYPNLSKIGIPYTPTVNRPIWVVNGKDHYMELLSFGKHTATTLSKEFQSLVDSVK